MPETFEKFEASMQRMSDLYTKLWPKSHATAYIRKLLTDIQENDAKIRRSPDWMHTRAPSIIWQLVQLTEKMFDVELTPSDFTEAEENGEKPVFYELGADIDSIPMLINTTIGACPDMPPSFHRPTNVGGGRPQEDRQQEERRRGRDRSRNRQRDVQNPALTGGIACGGKVTSHKIEMSPLRQRRGFYDKNCVELVPQKQELFRRDNKATMTASGLSFFAPRPVSQAKKGREPHTCLGRQTCTVVGLDKITNTHYLRLKLHTMSFWKWMESSLFQIQKIEVLVINRHGVSTIQNGSMAGCFHRKQLSKRYSKIKRQWAALSLEDPSSNSKMPRIKKTTRPTGNLRKFQNKKARTELLLVGGPEKKQKLLRVRRNP